jgi:hypothetical protein
LVTFILVECLLLAFVAVAFVVARKRFSDARTSNRAGIKMGCCCQRSQARTGERGMSNFFRGFGKGQMNPVSQEENCFDGHLFISVLEE